MTFVQRVNEPSPIRTMFTAGALMFGAITGSVRAQAIVDIGLFPGGTWNFGGLLSDDGLIASGSADIAGGASRGWRWTAAAGKVNLGVTPGSDHSFAYGLSGDGLVVVGASGGAAYDVACRWDQSTGMQSLGSLAPGQPSFAFGASYDGSVIVGDGYAADGSQRAFRWTAAGGLQQFGQRLAGTSHSLALGITGDGSTTFGYCYNNAPALVMPTACRWNTSGAITSLGVLPASAESIPGAISADGDTIVGYCADSAGQNARAFRWTQAAGMQELPAPAGASATVASSITADGAITTGYGQVGADVRGCIWTAAGVEDVTMYLQSRGVVTTGWTLRTANISANGSALTGWGVHAGANTTWYVRLSGCTGAPVITGQPQSQSIPAGSPVSFTVTATGGGLSYQWYHDGVIISGARAASYAIPSVAAVDAGGYECRLSSSCGQAASNPAILTVTGGGCTTAPVISADPDDVTVCGGGTAQFTITASGTGMITYQWSADGVDLQDGPAHSGAVISGSTTPTLTITGAGGEAAGSFRCTAINGCGAAASNDAELIVCIADLTCDDIADFSDYLEFLNLYELQDPRVDFDGDGTVDFSDYLGFLNAYDSGC